MTGLALNILGLILALAVPALIAMRVSQRWRMAGFLGWLTSPLILLLILATIEAIQKPLPGDLGKLLFGLAIIGSVLAIPWILACVVGFAIGMALRPKPSIEAPDEQITRAPPADLATPADLTPVANTHAIEEISPFVHRHVAPDGSILVDLEAAEWSNSHWVESPRVTETATGRVLLDLWGSDWDAAVSFPRDRTVRLSFRRYHVGGGLDVEIDLDGGSYVLWEQSGTTSHGLLDSMPAALEAASLRAAAVQSAPAPSAPRATPRSFGMALLILVGALLAIAGGTFITRVVAPEPEQHLDKIPAMPN